MRASKEIVIFAMVACAVGVSYFFWKGDLMPVPSSRSIAKGGEPKVAAQPGHPSILKPEKNAVIGQGKTPSNDRLIEQLSTAAENEDIARMVSLVPDLRVNGLLDSLEIFGNFQMVLGRLNANEIASLFKEWKSPYSRSVLVLSFSRIICRDRDIDSFSSRIAALRSGVGVLPDNFLVSIGESAELFSPDSFSDVLEVFEPAELKKIGVGLRARAMRQEGDLDRRIVDKYLESGSSEIGSELVGLYVEVQGAENLEATSKWLLGQPPDYSSAGDRILVQQSVQSHQFDVAIDHINNLLEDQDASRANSAAEAFADALSPRDPIAALRWASALPPDLSSRSGILQSTFAKVFHLHPERVEAELGIIAGDQDRADLARLLEILRGAESENP